MITSAIIPADARCGHTGAGWLRDRAQDATRHHQVDLSGSGPTAASPAVPWSARYCSKLLAPIREVIAMRSASPEQHGGFNLVEGQAIDPTFAPAYQP